MTSKKIFGWLKYRANFFVPIVLMALFLYWNLRFLDPDFGWHLRSGQYIAQFGVPKHDIFTYTAADFEWINHEWLHDLIVWRLHELGGYKLLAIVLAGLWTAAFWLARRKFHWGITILAGMALLPYSGIRPVIWSLLGFALLERIVNKPKPKHILLLPGLFLIWANLHGGFVLGLTALAYYATLKKNPLLWAVWAVAVIATFLNPYGPKLYIEIWRTISDASLPFRINEWRSLHWLGISWPYLATVAAGYWIFGKPKFRHLFSLPIALLGLAVVNSRHLPFFVLASLRYFEVFLDKFKQSLPKQLNPPRLLALIALAVSISVFSLYQLSKIFLPLNGGHSTYPIDAVTYLKEAPCRGNLFNSYGFGGFLIWQLPYQKVFIDGRMPSWKDADGQSYFETYQEILDNPQTHQRKFHKFNITCVVKDKVDQKLTDELLKAGWKFKVQRPGYELLVKP